MKILVCSCGFNSFSEKRVDVFQFDQAKALANRGHDVRIATLDMRSVRRLRSPFSAEYEQGGLKVFTVNSYCGRVPASVINPAGVRAAKRAVRKACGDGWRPDIIHAHFTDMGYFFCDVAKEMGVPYVITEHSSALREEELDETVMIQAAYAYPKADLLLAVGRNLAEHIEEKTGVTPTVLPNIVDVDVFSSAQKRQKAEGEPFVLTAAATLNYGKGMDVTLRAFARLSEKDTVLNILGDGPERESLGALAEELGVSERVNFFGRFTREQFKEALESTDCFVLASRGETFGVVYIEALAAGVPVIGTKCGGPEDFMSEDMGLLVEVDNVEALADAMQYMYGHSEEYDRELIKNKIKDSFSPHTVARELEKIYENLIG